MQWYDTWIKGLDTGMPIDTEMPLHLAELGGTERWINARWPVQPACGRRERLADQPSIARARRAADVETVASPTGTAEYPLPIDW